jgi:ankyrin repeat protein
MRKEIELATNGAQCTEFALDEAIKFGRTEIVKLLIAYGAPCGVNAINLAHENGNKKIVKMLENYINNS